MCEIILIFTHQFSKKSPFGPYSILEKFPPPRCKHCRLTKATANNCLISVVRSYAYRNTRIRSMHITYSS